jgi:hypothetical protein
MGETCQVFPDWNGLFGDHIAPYSGGSVFYGNSPCDLGSNTVAMDPLSLDGNCALECAHGYSSGLTRDNNPVLVFCWSGEMAGLIFRAASTETIETIAEFYAATDNNRAVFMHPHKTPLPVLATDLNCKANNCIPTTDEDLANLHPTTHILCGDSQIASGTTGDCKCSGEQATTTSVATSASSGHRIAEFVSAGHMFPHSHTLKIPSPQIKPPAYKPLK